MGQPNELTRPPEPSDLSRALFKRVSSCSVDGDTGTGRGAGGATSLHSRAQSFSDVLQAKGAKEQSEGSKGASERRRGLHTNWRTCVVARRWSKVARILLKALPQHARTHTHTHTLVQT